MATEGSEDTGGSFKLVLVIAAVGLAAYLVLYFAVLRGADVGEFEAPKMPAAGTGSPLEKAQLPAWLPAYPGATMRGSLAQKGQYGGASTFFFTTQDPMEVVVAFYEDNLKKANFSVSSDSFNKDGLKAGAYVQAKHPDGKQSVHVTVTGVPNGTQVNLIVLKSPR